MKTFLKSRGLLLLLGLAMMPFCAKAQVSVWDGTYTPWTKGTGTASDPFLIENARQLAYLATRVNNGLDANGGHVSNPNLHYKLMVDVNLNGSDTFQWTPIGYWVSNTNYQCFGGHFDGNNHTVSGLYINSTANRVGFFGYTDGAVVENLTVTGDTVSTTSYCAGGIIGYAQNGVTVKNCHVLNLKIGVFSCNAGGIIGIIYGVSTLTNCYNTGNVSCASDDDSNSGGIIGFVNSGVVTIVNCYNLESVSSSYYYKGSTHYGYDNFSSGGILGYVYNGAVTIANCYNSGSVFSESKDANRAYSGGIIGLNDKGTITINNCYNTGNVFAKGYIGGIIGTGNGTVSNCYYLSTCGGNNTYGGSPMTAAVMKTAEFVDMLNKGSCAWIQDVTPYKNGGYPVLSGIIITATTLNADSVTQSHAVLRGSISIMNDSVLSAGFMYKANGDIVWAYRPCVVKNTISGSLSGLRPSTTYVYEIRLITAGCDTTYGQVQSFTTQSVSVNTLPATNLTSSSATLNGQLNVGDANATGKGFRYVAEGDTSYMTVTGTGNGNEFAANLYGLSVNTNYKYQAFVAISLASGTDTIWGGIQQFSVSWLNEDTINIHDAAMLRWVADKCNSGTTFAGKYIRLMNNIVLPLNVPNNMASIGSYPNHPFQGTFDGNGMQIVNLYIDQPNTPYQGFFGYALNAKLYQVGLVNITASGRNYTGGMVAYAANTTLRDCYVSGGTLFALSYCGGLVGYQAGGTESIVSGCYNTCTVSGSNYVGGLVGYSNKATVRNSYVAANVAAQGSAVGAIIGGADEVLMYNCWFNSNATGQSNAIGENRSKAGNEGMTDAEMRDPQFVSVLNQGLVKPVWKSDYARNINKGFPILIWQYSDADTCGAPENLSTSVNAGTITFRWSGGENAKSFLVEYGRVGDTAQQMQTTARQLQVNYQQGETYFWRVKSICSFGESGFVNGSNVTTGIAEVKAVPSLKIYPNPTDGKFTVSGVNCNRLQVSDMYGKVLGTFEANGETTVLDFSRYAAGVYVIRAWDGARLAGIGKVVKR